MKLVFLLNSVLYSWYISEQHNISKYTFETISEDEKIVINVSGQKIEKKSNNFEKRYILSKFKR